MATAGGPNIERDGLVFGYDADNRSVRFYKGQPLLYSTSDWSTDLSQGTSAFSAWAGGNTRTTSTDPWGNQSVMWKSSTENSSASRGGLYGKTVSIDNTKLYRISYWENRVTNNNATYGRYYLGCHGYGSVTGVGTLGSGTANTNPYFYSTNRNGVPINTWVLVVGHIHPHEYSSTAEHVDSGRWLVNGTKYGNINTDYKWLPQTTSGRPRSLAIYQGNVSGMIHHTIHPRMDLCDGTEPSLSDLIEGKHHKLTNIKSKQEINVDNMSFDSTGHPVFDGTDDHITGTLSINGNGAPHTVEMIFSSNTNQANIGSRKDPFTIGNSSLGQYSALDVNTTYMNWYFYSQDTSFTNSPTMVANQFYHIVLSYAGGQSTNVNKKVWINGIAQTLSAGSTSISALPDNPSFSIGRDRGRNTAYWPGKIPVFKVYNRALSSSEVQQNYNAYKNRFNI